MFGRRAIVGAPVAALVLVLCVCLFLRGFDARAGEVSDAELHLLQRLFARISRTDLPKPILELSPGLAYTAESVSEGSVTFVRLGASGEPPLPWSWAELPPLFKLNLLNQSQLPTESLLDFSRFCFASGFTDEAHATLKKLLDAAPASRGDVTALLAKELSAAPPASGFVYFRERFVTPEERDSLFQNAAEAWLLEQKAVDDEKHLRGDAIHSKANALAHRGFFEMARALWKKVARICPNTTIGRDAAEKAADNCLILVEPLVENGPREKRLNFYMLGDGYTFNDRPQRSFSMATQQVVKYLFEREVFKEYRSYVNFYRAHVSSKESGVDTPTTDASTALGGRWSDAAQGQVTVDGSLVRQMLSKVAPDFGTAFVMVRMGGGGTGGGGIVAFSHGGTGVAYHEFGHAFGGLADEYSTQVSKTLPVGPVSTAPNLANSENVEECPWRHWIEANTPGVGLFRGGAGRSHGAWHPTTGCVMGAGGSPEFCCVCREQVVLQIYESVRPVDEVSPAPGELHFRPQSAPTLRLVLKKPESRFLKVTWKYNGKPLPGRTREIVDGRVVESVTLDIEKLVYNANYANVVEALVEDDTPWVLSDPKGLLTQKLQWNLVKDGPK